MTPLQTSILKTVSYFDVFHYPLRLDEIYRWLFTNHVTVDNVSEELIRLVESGNLKTDRTFYFLPSKNPSIITDRLAGEKRADKKLKQALWVTKLIKLFPFVRGIWLTGNLSKNIADKNSDIDFLIIAEPERLWICRFFLIMFKKIFLLNSKKYFCINYFIAKNNLHINRQNIYTACETATVKVLWNKSLFDEFCIANQWIYRYMPNWKFMDPKASSAADEPHTLQTFFETLLLVLPLAFIDGWLMRRWEMYWKLRYSHLSEEHLKERFETRSGVSASFGEDHHNRILREYAKRIERFQSVYSPSMEQSE